MTLADAPAAEPARGEVPSRPPDFVRVNERAPRGARDAFLKNLFVWKGDVARLPGCKIVKSSRRRTVAFLDGAFLKDGRADGAEAPNIYIKQERILGLLNILKSMPLGSHAALEYTNALSLRSRGVLAPRAVGYAEWRFGTFISETISVMEELAGGRPLDYYFSQFTGNVKLQKIARVAVLLAELHGQGVDLTDCHKANLLAMEEDGADLQLALVDLATIEFCEFNISRRVARVAQLLHSLERVLDAPERRHFVEHYARQAKIPPIAVDAFARRVREGETRVGIIRDRSRDKRCVSNSTEFTVERRALRRIYKRRDFTNENIEKILKLTSAAPSAEVKVIKSEGRTRCYRIDDGSRPPIFVKKIASNGILDSIASFFRGTRGMRAWKSSHALARRGLATPRAFALVESGFLLTFESAIIFEAVDGFTTLHDFTKNFGGRFESFYERRRFIETLAFYVARLHLWRVDHDDLATKNFLVPLRVGSGEIQIIDLEAVRGVGAELDDFRLRRAIMQLDDSPRAVSRADRMRFLVNYERFTKKRFGRADIAEIRALLRERFARSKRDYAGTGPK